MSFKMTKERFTEILKEYGYSDKEINSLWYSRPSDNLDEERLRIAAVKTLRSLK